MSEVFHLDIKLPNLGHNLLAFLHELTESFSVHLAALLPAVVMPAALNNVQLSKMAYLSNIKEHLRMLRRHNFVLVAGDNQHGHFQCLQLLFRVPIDLQDQVFEIT